MHAFRSMARKLFRSRRIYMDYAAATPVSREVYRSMRPYFSKIFANPGAIHAEGVQARGIVENARAEIAEVLRTRADEIIFTSGGTEGNNLALLGLIDAVHKDGRAYEEMEVVTIDIEHPSVRDVVQVLRERGVCIRVVSVGTDGRIDMNALRGALTAQTVLVTCAYANSEIGVVQDIKKVTHTVRALRKTHGTDTPYVHVDASQAPLYLPCRVDSLGVDLLTLDAGKCNGPKGVGVLVQKSRVPLSPLFFGGSQERGMRPGTENVPLVVGCAKALRYAQDNEKQAKRVSRMRKLQTYFFDQLESHISGVRINGSREHRIANNIHISIPGVDGEFAVVTLDVHGVAAATRSACLGASESDSYVVAALGGDAAAKRAVRFTIGERTTKQEIDYAVAVLAQHVEKMAGY